MWRDLIHGRMGTQEATETFFMHPRLQELTTYLDAQRAAVLAASATVPTDRWMEKPSESAWSVSEVLEHLRKSEEGVVRLIFKLGKQARATGARSETETSSVLGSLNGFLGGRGVIDRTVRREAPEMVRPGPVVPQQVVDGLNRTRDDLYKAIALVDGIALGDLHWIHPALGDLNLYQYILFVGQHEARHAMQVEEIGHALTTGAPGAEA